MNKFFNHCLKRLVPLGLAASAAAVLLAPAAANATPYIITLTQQGSNVVAIGSGAFDLTGLTYLGHGGALGSEILPENGIIAIGPGVGIVAYTGPSGPVNFGSGSGQLATSGSGDFSAIFPVTYGVPTLFVHSGYVSEDALLGTSTYDNASFASLGVTPGTYIWTWGSGADQSFTLDILSSVSVPEPAEFGMFGFGVLLIGAFVGLRRRTA